MFLIFLYHFRCLYSSWEKKEADCQNQPSLTQRSTLLKFLQQKIQVPHAHLLLQPCPWAAPPICVTQLSCGLVHFPKLTATELVLAKLYLTWLSPSSAHCFSSLHGNGHPRMQGAILLNPLFSTEKSS